MHIVFRPEADDVHALQQQLNSLHLVMEQSSSEHEKQLQQVSEEKRKVEREKESLCEQLESLRVEVKALPKREEVERYERGAQIVASACT